MKPEILEVLQDSLRPLMLERWRPDCCIATTRVICMVMKRFGIDAQPLPVTALAYNAAYLKAVASGDLPPTHDDAEFKRWCERLGAHSIGLTDQGGGHLVAVLPRENLLIDGSIGQMARPQKGIDLPEMLTAPLLPGFLTDPEVVISLANDEGCLLMYKKVLSQKYLASPDWTEKQRHRPVVKQLVREIEEAL